MKETRKQYEVNIMYKKFNNGFWYNAMKYDVNGGKTYARTLEEAKQAIENVRKMWEDNKNGPKVQRCGMISIAIEPCKDDTFEIVATRIRVREVTEWEEITE